MTTVTQVDSLNTLPETKSLLSPRVKKAIMIAVSTIFALGMIVSYVLGAPWVIPFVFFSLALAPLYPLGKVVDDQRGRILENN